jgi:integrase
MPKLSRQFIESNIELPTSGQRFYRDDGLAGFAVRATPKTKSYVVEKRVDGSNRRITIGNCADMTFEAARKQACIMLAEMVRGNDPKTGKRINPNNSITLSQALEKFLAVRKICGTTQNNYITAINRHFRDWLDQPITSITKDMVEQRHHELTVSPNRLGTAGHGRANNALKKLSTLLNWASDRFGTEDEPLIKTNPVSRLSRNRAWHKIRPRQRIIADDKLRDWYRAVTSLRHEVARDFLLFLLLTGMRFGETQRLKWSYVDFANKILIVPRELTKSDRELRLPLSEFLVALLKQRFQRRLGSEWVFQSARSNQRHLSQGVYFVKQVRAKAGLYFTFHDLRRTFLTKGAMLDIPMHALKRLVNHAVTSDITAQYVIHDMPSLRAHIEKIDTALLHLLGADINDLDEWRRIEAAESNTARQLLIPLTTGEQ